MMDTVWCGTCRSRVAVNDEWDDEYRRSGARHRVHVVEGICGHRIARPLTGPAGELDVPVAPMPRSYELGLRKELQDD